MLAVDLLHEFELGVWKAVFMHLVRLLYSALPAGRLVTELDKRYLHIKSCHPALTYCSLDFVWYPLSVAVQFADSPQMLLR
jgi:hypothetical protein